MVTLRQCSPYITLIIQVATLCRMLPFWIFRHLPPQQLWATRDLVVRKALNPKPEILSLTLLRKFFGFYMVRQDELGADIQICAGNRSALS